ncbi:phosphate transport system permease PstA [Dehalogenimonas sp. WBC-2]|nr:phosphate transport system permease PstA [Dehalogenimonas sp. WBC-2]
MTTSIAIAKTSLEEKRGIDLLGGTTVGSLLLAAGSAVVGVLILGINSLEYLARPLLIANATILGVMFSLAWRKKLTKFSPLLLIILMTILAAILLTLMPEYVQGLNIHGIMHRSLAAGLFLLGAGVSGACYSLYYMFRGTPRGFDLSRYPIIIFFAVAAFMAYGIIFFDIIRNGAIDFNVPFFTNHFSDQFAIVEQWQDGWPVFTNQHLIQVGILNHIMGTLMLMSLTSVIAIPIGVSVGIFVHEYGRSKLGGVINFSTTALRSISGVILAVTAVSLLQIPAQDSFWFKVFHGYGYDINGVLQVGRSSFLFASVFISLLVIPIIAKATMEGLNSLPKDIREGSLALGATKEHTLFHVQLPWTLPNIITGVVLGCAEAAGALTIIFLMSGTGQYGVNPMNETTSLAYLVFDMKYGRTLGDTISNLMGNDKYLAALALLIMTLVLTTTALIMKRQLSKRYKGG